MRKQEKATNDAASDARHIVISLAMIVRHAPGVKAMFATHRGAMRQLMTHHSRYTVAMCD